ncbi:putative monooxygenase [Mycena metata]|uniref:Monooxygenase n=1 Tax=Mycena metata TaxID=1033252 RepID=A0AAD7KBW6_9AGAR|nr:putative monooxygenase [Mycena metata]
MLRALWGVVMSHANVTLAALVAVAACVAWFIISSLLSRKLKRPLGPLRFPIVGNALQFPQTQQWLTFSRWAEKYGDVVYLEVFGKPLVLLNSAKAARDLLEQRSTIYSDRPRLEMASLSGFDKVFVLSQPNDSWRLQRKIIAQDLSSRMMPRYHAFQEAEARLLAKNLIERPGQLESHVKQRIGTIIIRITYGRYISGENDPLLAIGRASMDIFSRAAEPGLWLVDSIPMLKDLPAWLPGMGFLTTAKGWREIVYKSAWDPYHWSKRSFELGTVLLPNTCATALQEKQGKLPADLAEEVAWAACTMHAGGIHTSVISTLNFFLAMVLNPAIQAKAQKEIDAVIGRDRLPTIADRSSLPYVRSIVTEVFRLNPAIPLGIPHSLSTDDIYQGMHLPQGSIIIPNIWHMLHDPAIFPNPMKFDPDRYRNLDSEMEKVNSVFGFGRRICPGKDFGESNVFAIAATLLATCDIRPAVDARGNNVIPNVVYSSGSLSFPSKFDCTIKPRSKQAYDLLGYSALEKPDSSLVN